MSEILEKAKALLNDDQQIDQIVEEHLAAIHKWFVNDENITGLNDGAEEGWGQFLRTYLKYLVEGAEPVKATQTFPLSSLQKAHLACLKKRQDGEINFLKCFLANVISRGSANFPIFTFREDEYLTMGKAPSLYTRKTRLSEEFQIELRKQGLSDQIFQQLDDVLLEDYRIIKYFNGTGAFGAVNLVEDKNGKRFMIKKIPMDNKNGFIELKNILRVRETLKDAKCVVKIFSIGVDIRKSEAGGYKAYIFYIMEAADDLNSMCPDAYGLYQPFTLDCLQPEGMRFINAYVKWLMIILIQIIVGLNELHRRRLIHRDLKPANIAIFNGVAKIIDLGLVTPVDEDDFVAGTEFFYPQELFRKRRRQDQSDDLYALGKIYYTLLTNLPPERFPEFINEWSESDLTVSRIKRLIMKACSPVYEERFSSLREFAVTVFGKEMLKHLPSENLNSPVPSRAQEGGRGKET